MNFKLTEEMIARAADILNAGGVVIIPTDTVYGIAAHPKHPEAVQRICTIKGRPTGKPIALLAMDIMAVIQFGATFPDTARRLAKKYWPGALTLVLPMSNDQQGISNVQQGISNDQVEGERPREPLQETRYEGFRVPAHDAIRRLLALCGGVLRVTSANLSGEMPALDAAQALKDVGLEADMVLDDGISPGGVASTVVKVEPDGTITVIRKGAVSVAENKKKRCADNDIPNTISLL